MRLLEVRYHKAVKEHFCIRCCRNISAGEIYCREAWADGKRIHEFKTHYDPGCDSPPDEEERNSRGNELGKDIKDCVDILLLKAA